MKCPHCDNAIREVLEEDHELKGIEEKLFLWQEGVTDLTKALKDLREVQVELIEYVKKRI